MNKRQPPTVVIIESDSVTSNFLLNNLALDGFHPFVAEKIQAGLKIIEHNYPDIVLIGSHLPDGNGLELIDLIRGSDGIATRIDPDLPAIVISDQAEEIDRLRGFERGCDDYIVKPFSYPELRARINVLLRRREDKKARGKCRIGAIGLDPAARKVTVGGEVVNLSQKEFALLRTLASDPTRVFSKAELLRSVWGFRTLGSTRTLDSHACRLRRKLERRAEGDRFVINVWGVGYRLVDGVEDAFEGELLEVAA